MTTLAALLGSATKRHRAAVAEQLALASGASGAEIAATLLDPVRLAQIAGQLDAGARGLALRAVLEPGAPSLTGRPRADLAGLTELERHGLAFAFGDSWWREYRIPDDLRAPLGGALAARHGSQVTGARPKRWVGAPLQTAQDAAALSALMAREPVRVKADGGLYSRAWPALERALPPLPLADDAFDELRVGLALAFLRDGGFLRLRVHDVPGATIRRELVPAGDLGATLREPPDVLRTRLLTEFGNGLHGAAAALAQPLAGRAASIASVGKALAAMAAEAGASIPGRRDTATRDALAPLWLAGALELGLDGRDKLVAARFQAIEPEPAPDGPLAVCQANFEVVLLRPPAPADRLVLELCCERAAGQEHVLRLTRESVRCGARALRETGGVRAALERIAGELPQNVERSLADWAAGVRGPLRLRTALMIEAPDEQAADELEAGALAGRCRERVGRRLLAVPGDALPALERLLAAAGEQLEPGLDRISGTWREPHGRSDAAEYQWTASEVDSEPPEGKQVSTIPEPRAQSAATAAPARRGHGPIDGVLRDAEVPADDVIDGGLSEALDEDPIEVVLQALEEGTDVRILYAGARGMTERQVTPFEVDDARLHAWCHLRGDDRAFWLGSIQAASPVG